LIVEIIEPPRLNRQDAKIAKKSFFTTEYAEDSGFYFLVLPP